MTASAQPASEPQATFSLERFAWDTPDRLEVSGWFAGFADDVADPPVLVVHAGDATLSLPVVTDRLSGPPREGRRWWAAFAWDDAPAAFDRARLELGDIVVDLPQPRPRRVRRGEQVLAVRRPGDAEAAEESSAGERLALQAALLLAQEEIRSLRGAVEEARRDLQRAKADVDAERGRRATDSERFREGLDRVRASAEDAIAAERRAAGELARDLDTARRRLGQQGARLAELERVASESERRHAAIEAACAETEHLLARLTSLRDAPLTGEPA